MRFRLTIATKPGKKITVEDDAAKMIGMISLRERITDKVLDEYRSALEVPAVSVECLSLIRHPEFYQGPDDPDFERMMMRLRIESEAYRLRDWIAGFRYLAQICNGTAHEMQRVVDGDHYALVRDKIKGCGVDYLTACTIAMLATAPEHNRPYVGSFIPLFYQP